MFGLRRDACKNKVADILDKEHFFECQELMVTIKQARHFKTLARQLNKFDIRQHKHNIRVNSYINKHVGVHSYTNKHRNRDNCSNVNTTPLTQGFGFQAT